MDGKRPLNAKVLFTIQKLLTFSEAMGKTPVIHPDRAAAVLQVKGTVVREMLRNGTLQPVLRRGKRWVSIRSVLRLLEECYGSPESFNALNDAFNGVPDTDSEIEDET